MTISPIIGRFMAAALVSVLVAGFGGQAKAAEKAQCQAFPKVAWWGKISPERVSRYVDRQYDGDWKRYIAKWKKQLKGMVDVYNRNGTVVVKEFGIKLNGDKLGGYIANIIKRISITRCLAKAASQDTSKGKDGAGEKKKQRD